MKNACASTTTIRKAAVRAATADPKPVKRADLVLTMSFDDALKVIDLRSPEEFAGRHIARSTNIPDSKTTALVHAVTGSGDVVLVCADGEASRAAARTLRFCGFHKVTFLEGGFRAWWNDGLPTSGTGKRAPETAAEARPQPAGPRRPMRLLGPVAAIALSLGFLLYSLWGSGHFAPTAVAPAGACHVAETPSE